MNTFGRKIRLTTFGESHGSAMGGIIDGFPAGFKVNFEELQKEIDKRKPGSSNLTTQRKETDKPEFLSGISPEGFTLGTPIGFIIRNADHRSNDYDELKDVFRPNHADYTYICKYGIRDHRGGGRSSARETVNWVVGGALCLQWLKKQGIEIQCALTQVGKVRYDNFKYLFANYPLTNLSFEIDEEIKMQMNEEILKAKLNGDSIGGRVTCLITGLKPGIGNPVSDKLSADLAHAMLSINAVKGFEYGLGFDAAEKNGLDSLDSFIPNNDCDERYMTKTNFSGGIQGGISNGMPIYFSVAFKPTPTISSPVKTVNSSNEEIILKTRGRHDPCVALRGVAVVKAMTALVLADKLSE